MSHMVCRTCFGRSKQTSSSSDERSAANDRRQLPASNTPPAKRNRREEKRTHHQLRRHAPIRLHLLPAASLFHGIRTPKRVSCARRRSLFGREGTTAEFVDLSCVGLARKIACSYQGTRVLRECAKVVSN